MESENEDRPLLRTLSRDTRKRNICRRIPSEVAITCVILGLFLLVVTVLILLENLGSSSNEALTLDSNLLASPLKYNKKSFDNSWKSKGTENPRTTFVNTKLDEVKNWLEKWKKLYHVEILKNLQDFSENPLTENAFLEILQDAPENVVSEDINILGSPFKYNKKAFDTSWQNKKDFTEFIKNNNARWGDIEKDRGKVLHAESYLNFPDKQSDLEINLLGSPFKYNKKALDETWQTKKYFSKGAKDLNSYKWNNVDKGWKKFYPLGSGLLTNKEDINGKLESENYSPKADLEYGNLKWDNVNKGWKKISQTGGQTLKEMEEFYEAWKTAENRLKSEITHEKRLGKNYKQFSNQSVAVPTGCPFANTGTNLVQAAAIPQSQVNCALLAEQVRRELGRCIDLSFLPKECKPSWRPKCFSTYKYRKIDGSCNNQIHPIWGKSGTPFVRMIAPDYEDGSSSIRVSKIGGDLPNARFLSQQLYSKKMKPDIDVSSLFLTFGLIVDHDMVETAINTDEIPCCDEQFKKYPKNRPRECLQIDVQDNDPFYGPRNIKCLNVVRSLPVQGECIGRREQLNTATSFLDGSTMYGSTIQKMKSLRSFNKGQMRTQHINNTTYMVFSEGTGYSCGTPSEPFKCFEAGDSRVNMLVELTAMHTLWYREHNRISDELHKLNPKWTDEILFQEARRILIAELQHITYNEFLPLLLGEEAMDFFQLKVEDRKYYNGYDETIGPGVFNVFASAAFRFGHSLVQDMLDLIGPDNKTEGRVALHETYFNPRLLYQNGLDALLRGEASQKLHSVDSFISKEVREHLFQAANNDFGHDLAAVGIQRGRDHGLPGYSKWRSACGLPDIKSWKDLNSIMNVERANKLKEVYQSLHDIDLIPGALAEDHVEGSILGPTYMCIIGRQFKKTRKGDRFWFETQDEIGSFTKDQLKEIYSSNMARIVCDNSDNIQKIQKYPFRVPSTQNPVINCEEISKVDLFKWKAKY